jgi:hypothetical protein
VFLPESGEWQVWLGGSVRGEAEVTVNGVEAGSARSRLNNNSQFIELDRIRLEAGPQRIEVSYEQGGLPRPGTGAYPFGLGPVVLSRAGAGDEVVTVPASSFVRLCDRRLDWVEALR